VTKVKKEKRRRREKDGSIKDWQGGLKQKEKFTTEVERAPVYNMNRAPRRKG
jgi:hypothetical protein